MRCLMGVALAGLCTLGVPGCLVVSNSQTQYSGRYISESRLERIEPGRSTADDVLDELGEPTTRTGNPDGSEVWRYEYTKTKSSRGTVFLLFAGSNRTETNGEVQVTLQDGVVKRVWRDARGA
jgi:outer membrane protein assembly factor BamE (lipoprotein component of BamABCDE complex)